MKPEDQNPRQGWHSARRALAGSPPATRVGLNRFVSLHLAALVCVLVSVAVPCPATAADWKRVNASTLAMSGSIERDEFARFSARFDERVRRLVVTSPGGSEFQALQIGEVLARRGVDVYVLGYCTSACANFIFVAGRQRWLVGDAVVGYHGSEVTALRDEERLRSDLAQSLPPEGVAWKFAWIHRLGERAHALYRERGASTKILDLSGCITSHARKHWQTFEGDEATGSTKVDSGSTATIWLPSRAQFAAHGITVQEADHKSVAALGLPASALKVSRAGIDLRDAVEGEAKIPASCLE